MKGATWYQIGSNIFQLELQIKGGVSLKFDGFNKSDYESLKKFFETLQIDLKTEKLATKGYNWGEVKFRGFFFFFQKKHIERNFFLKKQRNYFMFYG